ncbi:patellin-3-like isoform X1 [Hordeum vulgare subsp. vulgare]|uniref:CRAL-TRIO domain-containing protein n=1 Tax=Hordeum vulgare subsp. vulgare TaxID=112509 RepID=A0A8I6XB44_HORVV|nr:patellin-3-like isoform X1 [Hordeum vulgare subsp. vulgare]
MAEEPQPQAAAPEVVVAEKAPAEVEKKAEEPAATDAAEAEAEETAAVADDGGAVEATGSFKEESNLVADLPDPEKKALDEFKELIVAALAAGEFNLPPPPPPPKAKAEAAAEETKTEAPAKEEAKTEEPAKAEEPAEEPKADEPAKEEPKAEVAAEPAAEEAKAEVAAVAAAEEPAKEEPKAEEDKPAEPKKEVEAAVVVAEEGTKTAEPVEEVAATTEQAPAAEAEAEAAAPEPVFIWGVPLVGDDERTDAVLLKFLRAREFKVKEAMAMLRSAVLWRKRFGIESLLEADLAFPELEKVVFYRGADREGHPVCYNVYGEFQDKEVYEKAFGDEEKRERFLKWRIQLLERGILSQLDFAPSGTCSMVQVTDLKNSPPMLGKHRAVTRQAVALLQDNYPEFIAKKVFINVPWWYLAANKMMSPFLTQRTKSKFVFASQAKSPETLFRYIAPEQVPVQFGGLFKEDDPDFTTSDSVTELTIKASSKEAIEIPVTENSTIVWELRVLGWEVSYGAEFTPDAEGAYTVIVQKTRKVPANEEPIMKGSFKASEAGKIVLTISNAASKKKKLLYRSKVKSSGESV